MHRGGDLHLQGPGDRLVERELANDRRLQAHLVRVQQLTASAAERSGTDARESAAVC